MGVTGKVPNVKITIFSGRLFNLQCLSAVFYYKMVELKDIELKIKGLLKFFIKLFTKPSATDADDNGRQKCFTEAGKRIVF